MNKILVKKFGGTSVQNIECIKLVAQIIKKDVDYGNKLVVIVSAMGNFTDQIICEINNLSKLCSKDALAEYDSVISAGEQISSGLLALELQNIGIIARSWLGWQLPIFTTDVYSKSRIVDIDTTALSKYLESGDVAVIAGFQGLYKDRITTLGRGGSDTSAVAISAALGVNTCDIYTDVDGVYTADPNIVQEARRIKEIAYDEMLEMASLGAKVLQVRSVELAKKYNVKLRVLSTFKPGEGTVLLNSEEMMESHIITGITLSTNEASFTLKRVRNLFGITAVFEPIAKSKINVDMIVQSMNINNQESDITFTIPECDVKFTESLLIENKDKILYDNLIINSNVAKVSIIGVGMISHSGIAYKMFQTLTENNIQILAVTTSEIKISVLILHDCAKLAANLLHQVFDLKNIASNYNKP